MAKNISDNPSFQNLRTQMESAEAVKQFLKSIDPSGDKFPGLIEAFKQVPDFQRQLEDLATAPDEFNKYYSDRGWAAYESMKFEVIETAVILARAGHIDDGEQIIIDYYDQNLKSKLNFISGVDAFRPRMRLIELALEDYYLEKYHSSIPVLLMMIDGVVNDVTKDLGLFAENVNVTAWDSIAAHEKGLTQLLKTLGKTRKKTNSESIDIPFRHGILHGKELAYDNKVVAVKTWSLLFIVRDWIVARKKEKEEVKKEKTLKKSLDDLKNTQKVKELIDKWEPRTIIIGKDVPKKGLIEEYKDNSPEQASIKFLTYWTKNNYGKMSEMIIRFRNVGPTDKQIAGELREAFEQIGLTEYELVEVEDKAPVVTEVKVRITLTVKNRTEIKEYNFRWIYSSDDSSLITRGQSGGRWYLIDNFRGDVSLLKLE